MKSVYRPISCAIRGRTYAAQAATKQADSKAAVTPQEPKVTRLPNGVVVATLENYSPVTSLAIVFGAGARYEPSNELGLTHCLRMASSQSTEKASAFGVAKNLQQIGAHLSCTTGREMMFYTVQCLREHFSTGLEYLSDVALVPTFRPWELDDAKARLQVDLDVYNHSLTAKMMDAIHKAAYRDTLGNPLYMSPHSVGSFSPDSLESFVQSRYVSSNATVAGVGIDHDTLVTAVRKMNFKQGTPDKGKVAKYFGGGELRLESPSNTVQAAIVCEGVSHGSAESMTAYVLQQAIGGAPWVQYGLNASSRINKAASSVTSEPFATTCFNLSYSDSGLFGLQAVASKHDIGKVLRAAVGAMKESARNGFSDADIQKAKTQVKALLISEPDMNLMSSLESVSVQAMLSGTALSGSQLAGLVDKITTEQVNQLAKKVLSGKPSMAAVGNLCSTPYLDELMS